MIIETFEGIALVNGAIKKVNIVTLPPGTHEIELTKSPYDSKVDWFVIRGTSLGNIRSFWINLINEGTAKIVSQS